MSDRSDFDIGFGVAFEREGGGYWIRVDGERRTFLTDSEWAKSLSLSSPELRWPQSAVGSEGRLTLNSGAVFEGEVVGYVDGPALLMDINGQRVMLPASEVRAFAFEHGFRRATEVPH